MNTLKFFFKKNILIKYKENIIIFFLIFLLFFADRLLKIKIIKKFNENSFYLHDYINIDLVWNTGIGFGLLSLDSILFYNIISLIISLVIIFILYLALKSDLYDKIMYSIIVGGAIGNLYDRLIFNAVPDFIDLHYKNFHWFTFNLADIFITTGIIFLLTKNIFIKNV